MKIPSPSGEAKTIARAGLATLVAVMAASCAELSLPTSGGAPDGTLVLPISFASQSSSVAGIQFDLQYDSSTLSMSATVGGASRTSAKLLYSGDPSPGQKRFLIVGLNQNPIADGVLVNLSVNVNSNALVGAYPVTLLNVVATDSSAQAVTINSVQGVIAVQGNAGSGVRLQNAGILNAASLLPGPVAPGEILTLRGGGIGPASPQLPSGSATNTVLGNTSVLFDGTAAPLLYADSNQIYLIAPYAIYGKSATQVQVTQRGQAIAALPISVADVSPAILTLDGSGVGQGAILNQNATVNSTSMEVSIPVPVGSPSACSAWPSPMNSSAPG